jgi:hypothetical protein
MKDQITGRHPNRRRHAAKRSRILTGTVSAMAGVVLVGTMYTTADSTATATSDSSSSVAAAAGNSSATTTTSTTTTTQASQSSSAVPSSSSSSRPHLTSSHGS